MILSSLISVLEVLLVTVPALLVVAFVTVAERKTMASMQRRLGPNLIGYYGLLQAFADALKLLLKEYVSPTQSNFILFFFRLKQALCSISYKRSAYLYYYLNDWKNAAQRKKKR